ncbi:hypothetical protein NDU88_000614 [Pleurodeles waltl]|uniref:Uncharacterized protein n=1 Tax=Pleurodeles waltl TaxID=8319 RepID=A0AAV7U4R0_PLEWA|nr:hypothetical protein NDU88_000614 [Pleurodeles waltl]
MMRDRCSAHYGGATSPGCPQECAASPGPSLANCARPPRAPAQHTHPGRREVEGAVGHAWQGGSCGVRLSTHILAERWRERWAMPGEGGSRGVRLSTHIVGGGSGAGNDGPCLARVGDARSGSAHTSWAEVVVQGAVGHVWQGGSRGVPGSAHTSWRSGVGSGGPCLAGWEPRGPAQSLQRYALIISPLIDARLLVCVDVLCSFM